MKIIRLDLNKYLGQSIKVLMANGEMKQIKVMGIQNIGGKQIISGPDLEGQYISIEKDEMEAIIN